MTVRDLAFGFAERIVAAERLALGMGFYDPRGFHSEALRVGLLSGHFALGDHQALARYIFQTGKAREFCTLAGAMAAMSKGPDPTYQWADECYLWQLINAPDLVAKMLPTYVETIRDNAKSRQEARAHLAAAARILDSQFTGDVEVIIQPKAQTQCETNSRAA